MSETLQMRMSAVLVDAAGIEASCTTYALVDPTADNYDLTSVFYSWLTLLDALNRRSHYARVLHRLSAHAVAQDQSRRIDAGRTDRPADLYRPQHAAARFDRYPGDCCSGDQRGQDRDQQHGSTELHRLLAVWGYRP